MRKVVQCVTLEELERETQEILLEQGESMKVISKVATGNQILPNQLIPVTTSAADEQATADMITSSMAIGRRRAPLLISDNDADYGTEPKLDF